MASESVEGSAPKSVGLWGYAAQVVIVVLGLVGFALLSLSIAGLFGLVSTPIGPVRQALMPVDLASSAVAGATLMLAVFTAYLALETRASVAATRREAGIADKALKVSEDALEATWRPLLVDLPRAPGEFQPIELVDVEGGGLEVAATLRNIGTGPAILSSASLAAGTANVMTRVFSSGIVAPHEQTTIEFTLDPQRPEASVIIGAFKAEEGGSAAMTVHYGDQGGHHRWQTHVGLRGGQVGWFLLELELSEEGSQPFGKIGPWFEIPTA